MNQQTSSTTTGTPRRGRIRVAAGLVLSAGLLLSAAACGDKGDTGSGGDDPATIAEAEIAVMKVCEQVNLDPLTAKVGGEFETGPEDVGKGAGADAGGPQCTGQITLPELRVNANSEPSEMTNANLNVAVIPYSSNDGAAAEFDKRTTEVTGLTPEGQAVTDLSGSWTKGKVISGDGTSTSQVYALVQQDSYLLKIQLSYPSDAEYEDKYPFTTADLAAVFQEIMTPFHAAVTAKVGG
ncbi:hypothetical protein AB0I28_33805 [Phytomonospora sp. NPDC050363]|uniref:hypothetical protein n=1 Tax=Phytomonospora sp. NPDC050363 TaxID=3155642 RepID=UPI00340A3A40